MSSTLPAPVQGYIAASDAFDGDALIGPCDVYPRKSAGPVFRP